MQLCAKPWPPQLRVGSIHGVSSIKRLLSGLRKGRDFCLLPWAAKVESLRDRVGLPGDAPNSNSAVVASLQWLKTAQNCSTSGDGGVARHFSLTSGWGSSYPETTGYIVPTFIDAAHRYQDDEYLQRARRMLDWLVSIQFPEGGFQGGLVDAQPKVPVTFNTGQILLGLSAGVTEFGDQYREPMIRAADWLRNSMDKDGCWRKHGTPFAMPGEKVYETHVAWSLLEAARIDGSRGYAGAALRNIKWALSHQRENGWFDKCCLSDPIRPLTHTLGYALRGVLEGWRFTGDDDLLSAAQKTADGLLSSLDTVSGYLPGRLDCNWQRAAVWVCLTGSVQVAHCWLILYQATGDRKYLTAGQAANRYVRRTIRLDGSKETRGGVKGSFPVYGRYCIFEYLNWAAKFFIDSHWLESDIEKGVNG
jgi:hypothetical protein